MGKSLFHWILMAWLGTAWMAWAGGGLLPKGTNLTSVIVISRGNLGDAAMQTMTASLQGLVARVSSEQIYLDDCCGYSIWRDHLRERYGIALRTETSPWAVLDRFKQLVAGYVLYDRANPNSVNAATSLSGPFQALAVDRSIEASVRAAGITNRLLDVSTRDEAWVWSNYRSMFSRRTVVEQEEGKYFHLRDYAALADAFTFFDGNTAFRTSIMGSLDPDGTVLGWGTGGENTFVGDGARQGVFTVAADWAVNLSVLSSVRDDAVYQRTYANPVTESNVHYVTFVVTDGDNVQWDLGGFPDYYNHPARGAFDMGWALSPALADLAPSVLSWYYEHASNGLHRDFFVAGPSGSGYFYPSMYPPEELDLHVNRLNDFMGRADLNLVQIIDFGSFDRLDLWDKYTAQPHIDALIYLEYAPYNGAHGAILWSNGKPVIGVREMLWEGIAGADEASVISHINAAPRDPFSPAGYSVVSVHVWSKDLGDVQTVVNGLAPDVRVVTPDVLAKLIQRNIGNQVRFDFADGLQGWGGAVVGKPYDQAAWTSSEGDGALLLDGSDLGTPDTEPNAWFSRPIVLPQNAASLRFRTKARNDGLLRVRLGRSDGGSITLLDWESLPDQNWAERVLDLAGYAGQTVTIFFEQNDGGQGAGEYRFVDDVEIVATGGMPPAVPLAPKLLAAEPVSSGSVELLWRDDNQNVTGFRVERKTGPEGDWMEIANPPGTVTSLVDAGVSLGLVYFYRVRGWNSQGTSSYSSERAVAMPRPLIRSGAIWKYLDRGTDPGPAWAEPGFSDSGWASGPAQLGYGDGDESTVVGYGPNAGNKYITTHFRHAFAAADVASIQGLQLRLLRDDGAVVYLNGREVFRDNLPNGPVGIHTTASSTINGEEEEGFLVGRLDPTLLLEGNNLLAAEIHQVNGSSSDISFDLELEAQPNLPPQVALVSPGQGAGFTEPARIWLEGRAEDDGAIDHVEFFVDETPIGTSFDFPYIVTWSNAVAGVHTLTARAMDNRGAVGVSPPVQIQVEALLIPAGSVWTYLDDGSNQGTEWRAPDFDDLLWASGAAPLGYGNGDEATVVGYGPDPANKYITTFFRHAFDIPAVGNFSQLELRLSRDDGAVVYLNGTEVFRSNMPEGSVGYRTTALLAVGGDEETRRYEARIGPGLLLAGRNVLAAEVHQANQTSSDLRYDLELTGLPGVVVAPWLNIRRVGPRLLIRWPVDPGGYFLESAARLEPGAWERVTNTIQVINNTNAFYDRLTADPRFYRLQRP